MGVDKSWTIRLALAVALESEISCHLFLGFFWLILLQGRFIPNTPNWLFQHALNCFGHPSSCFQVLCPGSRYPLFGWVAPRSAFAIQFLLDACWSLRTHKFPNNDIIYNPAPLFDGFQEQPGRDKWRSQPMPKEKGPEKSQSIISSIQNTMSEKKMKKKEKPHPPRKNTINKLRNYNPPKKNKNFRMTTRFICLS